MTAGRDALAELEEAYPEEAAKRWLWMLYARPGQGLGAAAQARVRALADKLEALGDAGLARELREAFDV